MGVDEETASLLRTEAAPEPRRGRSASVAACVAAVGVVRATPSASFPHPSLGMRDAARRWEPPRRDDRLPPLAPPLSIEPPPSIHP